MNRPIVALRSILHLAEREVESLCTIHCSDPDDEEFAAQLRAAEAAVAFAREVLSETDSN